MNLLDLKSWAYGFLQATKDDGNWPEAEMERYARDEEMRLFVHVVGKDEDFFYVVSSPISEVAGQGVYSLPTNCYKVIRLERIFGLDATVNNPIVMEIVDHNFSSVQRARSRLLWPGTPGTVYAPFHYQLHGQSQFELFPPPSTALPNSLRVVYAARPAGMVLPTDVPFQITSGPGGAGLDNLSEFHDIIALGMCVRALEHEEAYPQADRMERRYQERLRELDRYLAQINVQMSRHVHVTNETVFE